MGKDTPDLLDLVDFNLVRDMSVEEYFSKDAFAVDIFKAKYCQTKDDGVLETPAEVFWRVASNLAAVEETEEKVNYYKNIWFSLMWNGWFRPGGSIMSGVGSHRKMSLMNCCTLPLGADTLEAIAKCEYDIMKAAAYRQGVGVDFSRLRPRGSKLNNAAMESTGVIPWMDKISRIGDYVGQAGRRPALLLSLNIGHPDIEEFLSCKADITKINNANISVQITNDFMSCLSEDGDWELRFESTDTGEVFTKTVKAKELFNKLSERAKTTGEPGVQYRNLLQNSIMYKAIADKLGDERFLPHSSNACSEKFMAPYSVCNLSSINMEMFSTNELEYISELENIIPHITRMADNVITVELNSKVSPLEEQRWIVEQLREIGMGITNVHGWLLKQDIAYDSDEAIKVVTSFIKHYARVVFSSSMALGQEKGSAPAFDLLKDKTDYMTTTYFKNIVDTFYGGDASLIKFMRNMAHMSIAPTGSLSNTFPKPCVSSGIEPVISPFYWRKTRAVEKGVYTYYFVVPGRIKEYVLSKLDKDSEDYKTLEAFPGSVQDELGIAGKVISDVISRNLPKGFFKPAHELDPMQKIKLMGSVYDWIDASISCTYNLPVTATTEDVRNIYMAAYNHGVRAVSIYVDGSREGILIFEDPITNKNRFSGKSRPVCTTRPTTIVPNCAPKRPQMLPCDIHYTSVNGETWVVLVGLFDDSLPFEVFCGPLADLYLPKSCTSGKIVKAGGGKYSLEVEIRKSPVVYQDLAQTLMSDAQRALTRILSLCLRHGVPPKFLVSQMRKTNGLVTDFSKAVSRVLSKYADTYEVKDGDNKCPKCGENSLIHASGCIECITAGCGYSRCG